jgi:CRISPR-associated Csx14 family protein
MAETVFIATLGAEPQVVTLALDALLAESESISRVLVVHTAADRPPLSESLKVLQAEFVDRGYYGNQVLFLPHVLADSDGPLADVVTPAEIEAAFQSLYTLLRQYKYAGCRIHLSIAGGRKTMALFAMAAAQIWFDAADHVWHLVSDRRLIESRQLHATHPGDVSLIPVPVAHWGKMTPDDRVRARHFIEYVLTPAERELTTILVREGLSNNALARQLGKSPKTIANQLTSIYEKLESYFALSEPPDRTMLLVLLGSYS